MQSDGNTIAQNYLGTTSDGSERVTGTTTGSSSRAAATRSAASATATSSRATGSTAILVDGSAGAHDNVDRGEPRRHGSERQPLAVEPVGIAAINGAQHTVIGGTTAAEGNVIFGAKTGIDLQGVDSVRTTPRSGSTTSASARTARRARHLIRAGGRRQQRRRRDHRRQRRRQRRERARACELERPHGRPELHRRRSRRATARANAGEGIVVQQTDREAAAERAGQRQHDPLQQARGDHHLERRPARPSAAT